MYTVHPPQEDRTQDDARHVDIILFHLACQLLAYGHVIHNSLASLSIGFAILFAMPPCTEDSPTTRQKWILCSNFQNNIIAEQIRRFTGMLLVLRTLCPIFSESHVTRGCSQTQRWHGPSTPRTHYYTTRL